MLLYEGVHNIGGTQLIAYNSYVGIITNGICLDTVIFVDDTSRVDDFNRFALFVDDHNGILNVAGSYSSKITENEYYFSSVAPLCYIGGEGYYANVHEFLYEPDSVHLELRFWTLDTEPGVFTDSTEVSFYKKE